jgi:hypothetical protein
MVLPLCTRWPLRGGNKGGDESNEPGDFMPFRAVTATPTTEVATRLGSGSLEVEPRVLILVPSIAVSQELLEYLRRSTSKPLLISCSLGEGQDELVRVLRTFGGWSRAMLFENTASRKWDEHLPGRYDHILVDRICWDLDQFSPKDRKLTVLCHCERPEMANFAWPATADIQALEPSGKTAITTRNGESITGTWGEHEFNSKKAEIRWQHLRKRALVNGPHAITGLLCYRLLSVRGMEPDQQFLAPIQHMIRTEKPEWEQGMSTYLRLRAIEVALEHPQFKPNELEFLHQQFRLAHNVAKLASLRFFATNDRLDRLMHRTRLGKEMSKFEEHILKPIAFYQRNRDSRIRNWIYGRPNETEILNLQAFLTESFLVATKWLTRLGT